jgi:hypothetical protein
MLVHVKYFQKVNKRAHHAEQKTYILHEVCL